jgi:DNA-binding transcriptional LysR family regulator
VAGSDHPLTGLTSVDVKDLADHTVLLPKQDCSYRMLFEQILAEERVACASIMEFNSVEAIKQCVQRGIGVTLIPDAAIKRELSAKELVRLPWTEKALETAILMIRHKDKWISPVLNTFMDLVRENLVGLSRDRASRVAPL